MSSSVINPVADCVVPNTCCDGNSLDCRLTVTYRNISGCPEIDGQTQPLVLNHYVKDSEVGYGQPGSDPHLVVCGEDPDEEQLNSQLDCTDGGWAFYTNSQPLGCFALNWEYQSESCCGDCSEDNTPVELIFKASDTLSGCECCNGSIEIEAKITKYIPPAA